VYVAGVTHRQLLDCLAHGVVKVIQTLPAQSPVEGSTDVSAGQRKFDVVRIVYHGVLSTFQSAVDDGSTVTKNQKETHFDHSEDNTNGAKDGLGRRDTREFLREIQGFDGHIQH